MRKKKNINHSSNKKITENTVQNISKKVEQGRKPPYIASSLFEQVKKHLASGSKKPIRTKCRGSTITTNLIGLTIETHNGKEYIPRLITEDMVGRKLGEFAPTRKFKAHAGSKK